MLRVWESVCVPATSSQYHAPPTSHLSQALTRIIATGIIIILDANRVQSRSSGAEATHAARRRRPKLQPEPACDIMLWLSCFRDSGADETAIGQGGGGPSWNLVREAAAAAAAKRYSNDPACDAIPTYCDAHARAMLLPACLLSAMRCSDH